MFLTPFQKLPPSPVYFLFYGGCALVLLALLLKFRHVRPVGLYIAATEILGRTSLFVFIVQYFVYFSLFVWIDPGPANLWPVYFACSAALLWGTALLWDKGNLNKYLIVPKL